MLTDEQQNQVEDIFRLIPPDERAAFLAMLQHEFHGREFLNDELRRVGASKKLKDAVAELATA